MQAPPILISPDDFAQLHFSHLTEHPPDSLLFPFLHGIEGTNHAQNTFFISPYSAAPAPRPPRFRGLVWVVVEEDLDPEQKLSLYVDRDEDDELFDEEEDELDDMNHSLMDVDNVVVHEESHMHPVAHRDFAQYKDPSKVSHTFVRRASDVSDTSDTNHSSSFAYQPSSTSPPCAPLHRPPLLTSSFRPSELIQQSPSGDWQFIPLVVPDGISLRNFGIQVPVYATMADIVVYSPKGVTPAALEQARRFKLAIDHKRSERLNKYSAGTEDEPWLNYRVMVLDADEGQMRQKLPHLMVSMLSADAAHTRWQDGDSLSHMKKSNGRDLGEAPNTIDFARREKDEMRELTKASEIISLTPPGIQITDPNTDPRVGQLYLGNLEDVPVVPELPISPLPVTFPPPEHPESPFNSMATNPSAYDICVECHDLAPFPSVSQLKMAEEHLGTMERKWMDYCSSVGLSMDTPRPPPHANAILHLPFPSSPPSTAGTMALLVPLLRFFEKWLQPVAQPSPTAAEQANGASRRWSTVSNLFPSLSNTPSKPTVNPYASAHPPSSLFRARSQTTPAPLLAQMPPRTRPLKVLLYSADGYTESSVPALCLLMTMRGIKLPEAYLELQVEKQRSFFVYGGDLSLLKRVEARVSKNQENGQVAVPNGHHPENNGTVQANAVPPHEPSYSQARPMGRPSAKSVSFTKSSDAIPTASSFPASSTVQPPEVVTAPPKGRPRANTSPWLPSFRDHLSWFNDSRFDGSFPSRVLPFLYLGNLNHASNAYMLHALGITHVVSVGECALVPPAQMHGNNQCPIPGDGRTHTQFIQGKEGSLWIEEREGRIKVLDIKGVCDDGIDTLEPQLEPICDWIDKAREEGGKVLVHCRVGVSRSATVTIAYVMKHLQIPLTDAYLIVRSRRLSVLIQPNMRLLYNLLGWEIKLAKERANSDHDRLKHELSGALTWPFLAKEVHALNEKYLH